MSKWTSVKDKLPDQVEGGWESENCLITRRSGKMHVGRYDHEHNLWSIDDGCRLTSDVVAWMPLPEPCKETADWRAKYAEEEIKKWLIRMMEMHKALCAAKIQEIIWKLVESGDTDLYHLVEEFQWDFDDLVVKLISEINELG